jgi:hypothetical protein
MESILSILDSESGFSGFIEWRSNAAEMSWSHEFSCDSDTSEDANWVSCMIELGTIDVNNSSTGNWASQWSHLRKTWWVEEDELKSLSGVGFTVVEGKFNLNANQWWVVIVWWTIASSHC